MHIAKKILIGLMLLVVILASIGFLLPGGFRVERSLDIAASPEKIYPLIEDPRAWAKWTVWNQRDPEMQMTYGGAEKGEGANWSWKSKSEGHGGMYFTKAEAYKRIEYKLTFPEFNMSSIGTLELAPVGGITRVTWTNEGEVGRNPMMRYFALTMDSTVGRDFEAGLKNLKALVEK